MRGLRKFQYSCVFQLVRSVPYKMPIDFTIFLQLGLVHPDSDPFSKLLSFIQIPLYLIKLVETSSWNNIILKESPR